MRTWLCVICGLVYDQAKGWPEDEVEPDALPQVAASASPTGPVVIVGSGHAGYGLAKTLRALNAKREIHVFTADDGGLYSKPALSNALAMGKDAGGLLEESALAI